MPLINCEISIKLDWSKKYDTTSNTAANSAAKFAIADTKFCFPVLILSTQDNAKLQQ